MLEVVRRVEGEHAEPVCVPGMKNLITSFPRASVIPSSAALAEGERCRQGLGDLGLRLRGLRDTVIVGFSPLAMLQMPKFASATWAKTSPIERTSGVGLNAYSSSGTWAAALVSQLFARSNVPRTLTAVALAVADAALIRRRCGKKRECEQ